MGKDGTDDPQTRVAARPRREPERLRVRELWRDVGQIQLVVIYAGDGFPARSHDLGNSGCGS